MFSNFPSKSPIYKVRGWGGVILDCIIANPESQGATSFPYELARAPYPEGVSSEMESWQDQP